MRFPGPSLWREPRASSLKNRRCATFGAFPLRLLASSNNFIGVAFGADKTKTVQIQGRDPDELRGRLVGSLGKLHGAPERRTQKRH